MKRFYFYLLLCIFAGMVSSCGNSELDGDATVITSDSVPDPTAHCPKKDQSWTFLFYIVADDGSQSFDTFSRRFKFFVRMARLCRVNEKSCDKFGMLNEEMSRGRLAFRALGFMLLSPDLRSREVLYVLFRSQKSA